MKKQKREVINILGQDIDKKTLSLGLAFIVILGAIGYLESIKAIQLPSDSGIGTIITKEGMYKKAPELTGIVGHLNGSYEGIKIEDFKGKVVLIDFWTYTCINCIRTFPHLNSWQDKYADKGLVIIGVHTPEFEFEKVKENVQEAIDKYGIEYIVVQDNNYRTWNAFGNRFWPRKYLIDKDGFIRYDHIGEGAYDLTERTIQELLSENATEDLTQMPIDVLGDTTPRRLLTPELYAGYSFALPRGQNVGNYLGLRTGKIFEYELPESQVGDLIYLEGAWLSNPDDLQAQSAGEDSSINLIFLAGSVNIVIEPKSDVVIELDVKINGSYLTASQAGDDVVFDANGRAYVVIDQALLYNVYRGDYTRKELTLTTQSDQFSFSAFTFG